MEMKIFVLTHGNFGKYLVESAELIAGKIDNIQAISLSKEMSIEDYLYKVKNEIDMSTGEIVLLSDLLGGTPNNVAMVLNQQFSYPVISGVNLPMILELALASIENEKELEKFLQNLIPTSKESIKLQV